MATATDPWGEDLSIGLAFGFIGQNACSLAQSRVFGAILGTNYGMLRTKALQTVSAQLHRPSIGVVWPAPHDRVLSCQLGVSNHLSVFRCFVL